MRLTGSNSTPLFFLEFHSRGDAHSGHAVADLSVLVGERLCFVRRGEERVCGLLGVVGRIPAVRLICCGRSSKLPAQYSAVVSGAFQLTVIVSAVIVAVW